MTKICTRKNCEHEGKPQDSSNFSKGQSTRDGLASHCKSCAKREREELRDKRGGNWLDLVIGNNHF